MKVFNNKYLVPVWTILRVWLGYQWIEPAIEKLIIKNFHFITTPLLLFDFQNLN
jgi:hypothetical protein